MTDLADGDSVEMQGSGAKPYVLKNTGGVYSCSCPAWRNQSIAIALRTCKHLKKLRGEAAELARVGTPAAAPVAEGEAEETDDGSADKSLPLLLAERWTGETDITGWWLSEKLDGVRAFWNGRTFLSRLGNEFLAPEWFTAGLPDVPLDGELWLDRRKFQRAVSIVRRRDRSEHWRELRYVVFDLPEVSEPFEDRQRQLADLLRSRGPQFAQVLPQEQCRGGDHLRDELARVEQLGGEGLMLRQPGSLYVAGRSTTLLKVKQFLDGEARVIEQVPGAGRHKGRLGALVCELADGRRFSVGTGFSDAERAAPPGVGALIHFRYQELSEGGVPRFPTYVGVRVDVPRASASDELAQAIEPAGTRRSRVRSSSPPTTPDADEAGSPSGRDSGSAVSAQASGLTVGERPIHLECRQDGASKFWEVQVLGAELTVRWGKIGTAGQRKTKTFGSPDAAIREAEGLLAEKLSKGYCACP
jgi:DNA ligase-1